MLPLGLSWRRALAIAVAGVCALPGCGSKKDAEGNARPEAAASSAGAARAQRRNRQRKPFTPPTGFTRYENKRLGFIVWAPHQPRTKITPLPTPSGKTLADEFNFGVEGAGSALLVTVSQLPSEKGVPPDPEAALMNAGEGMRRKLSGTLVSKREWKLKSRDGKQHTGTELEIEGKVGRLEVVAFMRMVVRQAWMYQVLALHSKAAAASSKQGQAFVRSFQLGDAPRERKLVPGVLPVKIATPSIEVRRKYREAVHYLKVQVKATVVQELMPLEQVFFKVWCKLGAVQKSFEQGSQGLRLVPAKQTRDLVVAPFLDKPLDAVPETCQLDVTIRKAATDIVNLGSFCFVQKKVTKGPCPK